MDLDRRKELIERVVKYDGDPTSHFSELRTFGWDCEDDLVMLTKNDVVKVLSLFSSEQISAVKVRDWANFIERREDVELEPDNEKELDEAIFWLANPEINYDIDNELVARIHRLFLHQK